MELILGRGTVITKAKKKKKVSFALPQSVGSTLVVILSLSHVLQFAIP